MSVIPITTASSLAEVWHFAQNFAHRNEADYLRAITTYGPAGIHYLSLEDPRLWREWLALQELGISASPFSVTFEPGRRCRYPDIIKRGLGQLRHVKSVDDIKWAFEEWRRSPGITPPDMGEMRDDLEHDYSEGFESRSVEFVRHYETLPRPYGLMARYVAGWSR